MGTLKDIIFRKLVFNRRKNRRFKVKDSIFVVLDPLLNKRKQVIDMSMGGLSYVAEENHSARTFGLNILTDNTLYLDDKVSFIPISRSQLSYLNDNSKQTNLHAVEFRKLTLNQKSQLKNFIQTHTTGNV